FDRMRVQLAQLDNARKEFVANASHELRTPLFSIGGFLELLADEELDDETRRGFIETMQGQVERLTKLSTDLLDLSRVDAGQLTVVLEPVDLGGVVQMLAGELVHLASSTGHELRTAIDDDVWCLGDDARILQIGRALATNALTHTPPGTHVTLRARRRGDRAELAVEDDGPGIPASQKETVFARFYRADGGMASGSGLGLAIAREIARIMGGDVRLDSVSRPTVFTLDLPGEPVPHDAPRTSIAFSRENAASQPQSVTPGS
ncbi:MAG TPA: ATP-binding protein, partial [Gaiellaceae bacterium]|nr:ATP-binding protein [Gaiellaceae bacterium]